MGPTGRAGRGRASGAALLLMALPLFPGLVGGADSQGSSHWKLLAKQDADKKVFSIEAWQTLLQDADNPESDAYMIVGQVSASDPKIFVGGKYEFQLVYDEVTLEWTQTSWLSSSSITGFHCISPVDCGPAGTKPEAQFRGLGKSSLHSWAVLDGDGQMYEQWWNSVGTTRNYQSGITAWQGTISHHMQLLVKEWDEEPGTSQQGQKPSEVATLVMTAAPAEVEWGEPIEAAPAAELELVMAAPAVEEANAWPAAEEGPAYECYGGGEEDWSQSQRTWCCQQKGKGCTRCPDGLLVYVVKKSECPPEDAIHLYDVLPKCQYAQPGEFCEGDGDCGTANTVNNCVVKADGGDFIHLRDVYRKEAATGTITSTSAASLTVAPTTTLAAGTSTTTLHYDCEVGRLHWEVGWTQLKKDWCCAHVEFGCATTITTTLTTTIKTRTSSTALTTSSTMTTTTSTEGFDCMDGIEHWEIGWSKMKMHWCCATMQRGCPTGYVPPSTTTIAVPTTTTGLFDCRASAGWVTSWTAQQRQDCCEREQVGCPTKEQDLGCVDSRADNISFRLSSCGHLSYYVNGEQVLHHLWSVMVDGLRLHLTGMPVSRYGFKRETTLREEDRRYVAKITDLFEDRVKVEPVYEYFNSHDNAFTYHMGEPWQHETRLDLVFFAFPVQAEGAKPVYHFHKSDTNEHTFHFGEPKTGETKGEVVFYAYDQTAACTEPVFDFWRDATHEHTLHMGRSSHGNLPRPVQFRAYPPEATVAPVASVLSDGLADMSCFHTDVMYTPLDIEGYPATQRENATQCLLWCKSIVRCKHFVYFAEHQTCHVIEEDAKQRTLHAEGVIAGSASCFDKGETSTLFSVGPREGLGPALAPVSASKSASASGGYHNAATLVGCTACAAIAVALGVWARMSRQDRSLSLGTVSERGAKGYRDVAEDAERGRFELAAGVME